MWEMAWRARLRRFELPPLEADSATTPFHAACLAAMADDLEPDDGLVGCWKALARIAVIGTASQH
jgi:hypothetical protein